MSAATVVVLLTLLLGIQPVTTDLYLPTLPPLQQALGASVAATQLTLSALIISFGFAQLAGGVAMAVCALAGVYTIWAVFLPQRLFGFGHGIHQPCSQVGALAPFPDRAGAASAMSGFLMMLTAFVAGLWLGENLDGMPLPLGLGVGFFCVLLFAVVRTLVVRHGEPAAATLPVAR